MPHAVYYYGRRHLVRPNDLDMVRRVRLLLEALPEYQRIPAIPALAELDCRLEHGWEFDDRRWLGGEEV